MKIHNFIKNSLIDYSGYIACVAFLKGCNWNCWYCQNQDLLSGQDNQDVTNEFFEFLNKRKGQIDAVVICGGEPTLHKELPDLITKIKQLGFRVKLDTNGTNPIMLKKLINAGLLDYVAMDIKAPFDKYNQVTKVETDIQKIQDSINLLKDGKVDYEFRTTVCTGLEEDDILSIAKSIQGAKRYILQPFVQPKHLTQTFFAKSIAELQQIAKMCCQFVPTISR